MGMSIHDFRSLMPHQITIEAYQNQNQYGEPNYLAAVSYTARAQGKMQMVRDATGVERVSTITVYVATTASIGPKDKLTLPTGWTPASPSIIAVQRVSDESGDHHTVIYA